MKKSDIIFYCCIIILSIASLIISFMTLSEINMISNKTNENSTVYYGTTILQQMAIQQLKSL